MGDMSQLDTNNAPQRTILFESSSRLPKARYPFQINGQAPYPGYRPTEVEIGHSYSRAARRDAIHHPTTFPTPFLDKPIRWNSHIDFRNTLTSRAQGASPRQSEPVPILAAAESRILG